MFRFLRQYPLSLICVAAVWYLSLYRVPPPPVHLFSWFDKMVHFLMYATIASLVWTEYGLHHPKASRQHILAAGVAAPILMGGMVELAQAYLTTYRSGDWLDFLANSLGVISASAIAAFVYARKEKWRKG